MVTERDEVNVGVPVAVPSAATGQLGAVQAGPVTAVVKVILLEVPWTKVAVTVAVPVPVWTMMADGGLTARL